MSKGRPRKHAFVYRLLIGLGISGVICLILVGCYYFAWSLTFDLKEVGKIPERSWVYDMDGQVYSRLHGENRILVEPDRVSPFFKKALLAREDARFYQHHGLDVVGIARAVTRNITHLGLREGGSTITQQLARNSFRLGGRDLSRKILEAFVALRIEMTYSKDQILGFYMNRIYFGSGYYGLETASRAYFGKRSADLTPSEAALLAGLIRSPNRFSPFNNLSGALAQRNEVLGRLVELKMISPHERDVAKGAKIQIASKRASIPQENYAMDALYRELQGIVSQDQIDGGGLRVYTSLDPELQKAAEGGLDGWLTQLEKKPGYPHPKKSQFSDQARNEEQPTNYLQGSVVVLDNHNGAIRALVGGRDYRDSKFNRALQANRQVGSTFKPFVYAAAFSRGMMPGTSISDGPLRPGEIRSAPGWNPNNSDGTNRGILPARDGLILSRNTMTIRVGELATLERVINVGHSVGFSANIPNVPATYLGAFEATLKDVVAAYSVFAAQGVRREPYLVERIDDAEGNIIYQAHPLEKQSLPAPVSWMMAQTIRGVIERGTASSAKSLGLTRYAAGKTGTTDDYKDAWFVGFTNSLTCGVWVGFDRPQTIQERGYGAALALPVWVKVLEKAPKQKYPDDPFPPPEPLVPTRLCSVSNKIATDSCSAAGTTYEIMLPQSMVPDQACPIHRGQELGRVENRPTNEKNFGKRLFRTLRNLFGG
jgi:penicillin-binding protein 1A